MELLSIKRSGGESGVKIYGTMLGDKGITYRFAYIRRQGFRGWQCSCDSFVLDKAAKNRNCKHIKEVRKTYGRYGTLVQ